VIGIIFYVFISKLDVESSLISDEMLFQNLSAFLLDLAFIIGDDGVGFEIRSGAFFQHRWSASLS